MPARKKLQYSSRDPTMAEAIDLAASVVRVDQMWCKARVWKYDASHFSDTCSSKDSLESRDTPRFLTDV